MIRNIIRALLAGLLIFGLCVGIYTPCAAAGAEIAVDAVSGMKGDVVPVTIQLNNNPGIASMKITVQYDAAALELKTATISNSFAAEDGAVPVVYTDAGKVVLSWVKTIGECAKDDVFATLTFLVKDGASGHEDITVTYDANDVFDEDFNNVHFAIKNGAVSMKTITVDVSKATGANKLVFNVSLDGFYSAENMNLIAVAYYKTTRQQVNCAVKTVLSGADGNTLSCTLDVPIKTDASNYEWQVFVVNTQTWTPLMQAKTGYFTVNN